MTTSVCPFSKAPRPDNASAPKQVDTTPSACPFSKAARPDDDAKQGETTAASACPFSKAAVASAPSKVCPENEGRLNKEEDSADSAMVPAKCPFGYDSQTFKLGPFSCMLCQSLLFDSTRCVPCTHVFCKACLARFKDCPLCGADIESIEADENLQKMVDQFIEGHARIKRSLVNSTDKEDDNKKVVYADVSMERGSFLVQQAMRAFQAQNYESAKSRLAMCTEDIRDQLGREGNTPELCSQLGAVLGILGDCSRAMGDSSSAVKHLEESIEFLMKLPMDDLEITHTLSVSLNKIGDVKYYDGDIQAARSYYIRALDVRRDAMKHHPNALSQILDVAVSLAKVADIDRTLTNEDAAIDGFKEGMKLLESLKLDDSDDSALEQRRLSVLEFLKKQVEKPEQSAETAL
ncbi:Protein NCA1 [Hirschfeldia incana]|nr:Protein NCA1 [Hirschfeldia incana]KAJ0255340.1 Protein NCA1 [Hirschfeldia incana]KAJ0255341.1 Protein NCA1 [Hirschfeldia incana]